jgi:hypothetical protein
VADMVGQSHGSHEDRRHDQMGTCQSATVTNEHQLGAGNARCERVMHETVCDEQAGVSEKHQSSDQLSLAALMIGPWG